MSPSKNWENDAAMLLDVPLVSGNENECLLNKSKDPDDQDNLSQIFKKNRPPDVQTARKTRQKARSLANLNKANNKLILAKSKNIPLQDEITDEQKTMMEKKHLEAKNRRENIRQRNLLQLGIKETGNK